MSYRAFGPRHLVAIALAACLLLACAAAPAQAAPFLYVANGGSQSISQYNLGPNGLLQTLSPSSVATGGSPSAVAVSPDARSVYVSHFAGAGSGGFISQYDLDANGILVPKSPATVPVPPGTPPGTPLVDLAVNPDGASLYALSQLGLNGAIYQYDVGIGGTLAPKSPATVPGSGREPLSLAVSPDGRSVYVTDVVLRAFGGRSPTRGHRRALRRRRERDADAEWHSGFRANRRRRRRGQP